MRPIFGKQENPRPRRKRLGPPTKKGRSGPTGKRAIGALVERGGSVRSFHAAVADKETVTKIVRENIARESRLHTDESLLYGGSKDHFSEHGLLASLGFGSVDKSHLAMVSSVASSSSRRLSLLVSAMFIPDYHETEEAFPLVYNLGRFSLEWNMVEQFFTALIWEYLGDFKVGMAITGGLGNQSRADIILGLARQRTDNPDLIDKVEFACKAFNILRENRNMLIHIVFSPPIVESRIGGAQRGEALMDMLA